MKKNKKKYLDHFLVFVLIVFVSHSFSLFENIYFISKNNYNKRNIINYGYCNKEGFGFVYEIKKKYFYQENIQVINYGNYPTISGLFYNPNKLNSKEKVILINSNFQNIERDFTNIKILENFENKCFLISYND